MCDRDESLPCGAGLGRGRGGRAEDLSGGDGLSMLCHRLVLAIFLAVLVFRPYFLYLG